MIRVVKLVKTSLTRIRHTFEARAFGIFKQKAWLLFEKLKLPGHHENPPESHGSSPVMLAEKTFSSGTYYCNTSLQVYIKITVELGINCQELQSHTCLLDAGTGLNLFSKAFLKKEWLTNIKKQQLSPLRTATEKPDFLGRTIFLFLQIDELSI